MYESIENSSSDTYGLSFKCKDLAMYKVTNFAAFTINTVQLLPY